MMFRRPSVRYSKTPEPVTPYQKAAQVWDERIGSARVQARNWRMMAFGSLLLSGGLSAALVWQSTQGTITPYVVEVDRLGAAQAVAPATADFRPTDPQIAYHLSRFIENVRQIPADPIVLRQNWLHAYDFTTDRGALAPPRPSAAATGTGASIWAASTWPKASMSRSDDQEGARRRSSASFLWSVSNTSFSCDH